MKSFLAMFILFSLVAAIPIVHIVFKKIEENKPYIPPQQPQRLRCAKCDSLNISVQMQTYNVAGPTTTTTHKRSLGDRAIHSAGRTTANLMTMGMYGVTHKKQGKYIQTTTQKNYTVNNKTAICQECGFSWNVK